MVREKNTNGMKWYMKIARCPKPWLGILIQKDLPHGIVKISRSESSKTFNAPWTLRYDPSKSRVFHIIVGNVDSKVMDRPNTSALGPVWMIGILDHLVDFAKDHVYFHCTEVCPH
ncbi:hypothetical protein D2U88_17710 [Flagellimonas aequoris]|uniref:Uncharacterized protein n=1 Tax=Flagellimonas aequoris TaxID=2306997 RepID=A0A418N256_9FLAO|nr:hypothetical protein D2U88_17710 [Allomuricauda aequoris]